MDRELYYIFAILASSLSASLAFVNTYLLLKDRAAGIRVNFLVRKRSGTGKLYTDPKFDTLSEPLAAYHVAAVIENCSSNPITIMGVRIEKRKWRYVPYFGRETYDPKGVIEGSSIAIIEPRSHVIFEFPASMLDTVYSRKVLISTTAGVSGAAIPKSIKKALTTSRPGPNE